MVSAGNGMFSRGDGVSMTSEGPSFHPRLPAEWEPQARMHLAWPVNPADWPGKYHAACWAVAEIARLVTRHTPLCVTTTDISALQRARRALTRAGVDMDKVRFEVFPLDRGWMRDISPFWVLNQADEPRLEAVLFGFNGWARYPNYQRDARWAEHQARTMGVRARQAAWKDRPVVLEGGAVDTNGAGVLLATEECLLDTARQPRNPGMSRADYEACFQEYLGIRQVIWLGAGIGGDDTHGHVDDLCRFVGPHRVVLCRAARPDDPDYAVLEENRERLEGVTLPDGARLDVVYLPMPEPVMFDGMRLPASYANFLVTNGAVLVPTFNDPADRVALGILAECFPEREVRGVHAVDLVWGLGAVHCLTHEVPWGNGEPVIPARRKGGAFSR